MTDTNFNEANKLFQRPEVQTYQSEQQRILNKLARFAR
jgi:hypothetical protein